MIALCRRDFVRQVAGTAVCCACGRALAADKPKYPMHGCPYEEAECPGLVYPKPPPGKIVVMQCWDDAMETDLRLMEICRKYKAKATFNLIPREKPECQRLYRKPNGFLWWAGSAHRDDKDLVSVPGILTKDFKSVYRGFRVAAHNFVAHDDDPKHAAWSRQSMAQIKAIITEEIGQKHFGYVYPGGSASASAQRYAREGGALYGRATLSVQRTFEPVKTTPVGVRWRNPFCLGTNGSGVEPVAGFFARYEAVKAQGGFFWFWGHTVEFGFDPGNWEVYEEKIARISSDKDATWIDPIDLFARM